VSYIEIEYQGQLDGRLATLISSLQDIRVAIEAQTEAQVRAIASLEMMLNERLSSRG
jgi:hypothetical protein